MASGVQVVGSANISGNKTPLSNPVGSSWLAFSNNRQSLPNYPDIVDNETYFQPVSSESVNDLTPSRPPVTEESDPAAGISSGLRPAHHAGEEDRQVGTQEEVNLPQSDMSGAPPSPLYPPLPTDPSVPPSNGTRPPQIPTYRQIQTRDISVGVSARIDPQRADTLPDLLHSHVASPVTPSRPNQHRQNRNGERRNRGAEHRTRAQSRHRTHENGSRGGRHGHRSRTRSTSSIHSDDGACKEPCVKCLVKLTSFRWVLVVLSLLGVCCVVTGIVLAALHAAGSSFLFLAIMFIGLGVLLVIVVGVGWKCTPRGHEPLHALFNIGDFRRRRDRHTRRAYRQRDSNWYGGVMYPEFQYRRPPPSYAASMQEYQQQLLIAQQQYLQQTGNNGDSLPNSPPPSYRSRTSTIHSGIHIAFPPESDQPNSRPPTYRSSASTIGRRGPVRPPLPRDHSNEDRGDNLPGGDVSFAGPDISPSSVVSDVGPTSAPPSASVDRTTSDESFPTSSGLGSSSTMPNSNTPSSVASLSPSHNQTSVTNPEQISVIQRNNSSVSGGRNVSNTTAGGVPSNTVTVTVAGTQPKDDNLEHELQQTLRNFDEITSLAAAAAAEPDAASTEQTPSSEEPERFQTAL